MGTGAFKGDYVVQGVWSYAKKVVKIRELPIGTWTSEYKAMLTVLEEEGTVIKEFTDMSTDQDVHFDAPLRDRPVRSALSTTAIDEVDMTAAAIAGSGGVMPVSPTPRTP